MFRKYMIFILAAFMIVGTSACTSKGSTDDAGVESGAGDELAAVDGMENSDGLSTDDGGAVADLGGIGDDLAPEEKLPDDKAAPGGDALADAGAPPADPGAGDVPPPPADDIAAATNEPAPPPEPMETKDAGMTPAEPMPPAEPMAPPVPEPVAETAKPAVASLQKVKTTPWKQGKILANAIYIARAGDSPDSISQKVFGSKDKVKELCRVNSYNCSRPTKVGDKFYYQSPQRPTDDTTVKTFYEDAGIAPQMYTAQEGDNIRKVGKELLGDSNSWKEIWSTNDIESKQGLDAGTQLKYWPDAPAAPAVAQTEEAPAPPADQAAAEMPPPPPPSEQAPPMPDQAAAPPPPPPPPAELPPAPPQDQPPVAAAATAAPPEPPPPPPPPSEQAAHSAPAGLDAGATDPNQTMALGVGAVLLLAAAALFISIRKKRARRQIDFNTTTQTQIE